MFKNNTLTFGKFQIEIELVLNKDDDTLYYEYTVFYRQKRLESFYTLEDAIKFIDLQDLKNEFKSYYDDCFTLKDFHDSLRIELNTFDPEYLCRVTFKDKVINSFQTIEMAVNYIVEEE